MPSKTIDKYLAEASPEQRAEFDQARDTLRSQSQEAERLAAEQQPPTAEHVGQDLKQHGVEADQADVHGNPSPPPRQGEASAPNQPEVAQDAQDMGEANVQGAADRGQEYAQGNSQTINKYAQEPPQEQSHGGQEKGQEQEQQQESER